MARRNAGILPDLDLAGVLAADGDRAAARPLEQRDELEHAALAGAGAAGEEHELAGLDL